MPQMAGIEAYSFFSVNVRSQDVSDAPAIVLLTCQNSTAWAAPTTRLPGKMIFETVVV